MKTLLSILFLFTALSCSAQYHNVEGIRVVGRSDSTTISNVGQIQFDADDDKFRFNDGTGWFSYLKEGSISASNGITKLGNDFQLGGALTKNTNINGSSYTHDLTFSALNTFQVTSDFAIILSRIASESTPAAGLAIGSAGVVRFIKGVAGNGQHYGFTTDSLMVITDDFKHIGLQYNGDYSANFTDSSLVDKRYVDGKILEASGALWPLTGTAALTGNVTINGGGTNDLSFGASGSRLDDLSLYADNQALINVASGNNVNRVILQPGLSSFTLLDTDGMTLDVEILVQPGDADILRIVKDESVTVFEINADGSIVYGAPPTDCTGHATNTIWSDNGTLKLCP